ncbi:hypothetical protein JQC67_12770 [Aurantibacter crassamenti]|uniref:hypothetical protein n=1 Tax=Aurantibacter crassamenti TaxID=1837375 RepID=UPI00193A4D22|nr:hypothetical protein [Aurantibacter crassamenti]MBM1107017.1 hypothetical protein [Aurantibacter crassamenti]
MKLLHQVLSRTATVKNIWFLFLSSHLILVLMMTYTFPKINKEIGTKAFDLQTFGYSFSDATLMVNAMNDKTINLYLFPQLSVLDVLYPFLLALFLSSLLFRLFRLTKTNHNRINSILLILPFFAMLFDYLENICIILMITKSFEFSNYFVAVSSTFTIIKSVLTTFTWLCILFYVFKWVLLKKRIVVGS